MNKITRRSFVKRTGGVSLGSVLGLGLLPSVTRRLHAADFSSLTNGVSHNLNGSAPDTSQNIAPDYRNAVEVQEYLSSALAGGTLQQWVHVGASLRRQECNYSLSLRITRQAVFSIVVGGVTYISAPISLYLVLTYDCQNGVLHKEEELNTHSAVNGEPLIDGNGNKYAAEGREWRLHVNHSFWEGKLTMTCYLNDGVSDIGQALVFGSLQPAVNCCLL